MPGCSRMSRGSGDSAMSGVFGSTEERAHVHVVYMSIRPLGGSGTAGSRSSPNLTTISESRLSPRGRTPQPSWTPSAICPSSPGPAGYERRSRGRQPGDSRLRSTRSVPLRSSRSLELVERGLHRRACAPAAGHDVPCELEGPVRSNRPGRGSTSTAGRSRH
jgi:hypothetical protein